jgi:hypothetical protein
MLSTDLPKGFTMVRGTGKTMIAINRRIDLINRELVPISSMD